MVSGKYRSRSLRRIYTKTPGGRTVIHYKRRKPSIATCGKCGAKLNAVPRENSCIMKNLPKTHKRPERPYGGVLCSKCMRILIKEKITRG